MLIVMVLFETQEENYLPSPPCKKKNTESRIVSIFKYVWVIFFIIGRH